MIDHPRLRIKHPQPFHQRKLQRFGGLGRERFVPVHDPNAFVFQVLQIIQRIKNPVSHASLPGRRTHPVKQQRILLLRRSRIVAVIPRIHFLPRHLARVHLRKQRHKPIRLLVINRNRLHLGIPVLTPDLAHALGLRHFTPCFSPTKPAGARHRCSVPLGLSSAAYRASSSKIICSSSTNSPPIPSARGSTPKTRNPNLRYKCRAAVWVIDTVSWIDFKSGNVRAVSIAPSAKARPNLFPRSAGTTNTPHKCPLCRRLSCASR